MSDPYDMESALVEVEAENPLYYTYAGATYPCSRGDVATAQTLGMGGFAPEADCVLVVRMSTFSAQPPLKSEVYVDGKLYLLDSMHTDSNYVFQVWTLSDPNKGT